MTEARDEVRLVALNKEAADFARELSPEIGPLFGRNVARAWDNGITEEEVKRVEEAYSFGDPDVLDDAGPILDDMLAAFNPEEETSDDG